MTTELFSNNAQTTLAGSITNLSTTLQLSSGAGALFPNPTTGQFFRISLSDAATQLNHEIVYCTARTGDVCTIQRAQEGTTAQNWNPGDIAANLPTAGAMSNVVQQTQFQNATYIYGADAGSANTYQVAYSPAVTLIGEGMVLRFRPANANTNTSTFSPNGITASPIYGLNNLPLKGGEIVANGEAWVQWNSSLNGGSGAWTLLSSSGGNMLSGRLINIQIIAASGTYTPTAGMDFVIVKGCGGGGQGGGCPASGASQQSVGSGGSAGSSGEAKFTAAQIGGSQAATIGLGGTGASAGANGNTGGTTSLGSLLTFPGGTGGFAGGPFSTASTGVVQSPAQSSAPTGANIFGIQGESGTPGLGFSTGASGSGGSTPFGSGGTSRATSGSNAGTGYGSGSSGALLGASSSATSAVAGQPGILIIYEFGK